jgi:hypothetical protein
MEALRNRRGLRRRRSVSVVKVSTLAGVISAAILGWAGFLFQLYSAHEAKIAEEDKQYVFEYRDLVQAEILLRKIVLCPEPFTQGQFSEAISGPATALKGLGASFFEPDPPALYASLAIPIGDIKSETDYRLPIQDAIRLSTDLWGLSYAGAWRDEKKQWDDTRKMHISPNPLEAHKIYLTPDGEPNSFLPDNSATTRVPLSEWKDMLPKDNYPCTRIELQYATFSLWGRIYSQLPDLQGELIREHPALSDKFLQIREQFQQ